MAEYSPHRMGLITRLVTDPHDMLQHHGAWYAVGQENVVRIEEHRLEAQDEPH